MKSIRRSIFPAVKYMNLKKIEKLPLQTLLFFCLKFISYWKRRAVKIVEFIGGNLRKSLIKP